MAAYCSEKYRIVDISFAFKNATMLKKLKKINVKMGQLDSCCKRLFSCCLRLYHRRRLNLKINADFSDDSDSEEHSLDDSSEDTIVEEKQDKRCCKRMLFGSSEQFNAKVDRYIREDDIEQFFKDHDMDVDEAMRNDIAELLQRTREKDKIARKTDIREFIREKIQNYSDIFAGIDE